MLISTFGLSTRAMELCHRPFVTKDGTSSVKGVISFHLLREGMRGGGGPPNHLLHPMERWWTVAGQLL